MRLNTDISFDEQLGVMMYATDPADDNETTDEWEGRGTYIDGDPDDELGRIKVRLGARAKFEAKAKARPRTKKQLAELKKQLRWLKRYGKKTTAPRKRTGEATERAKARQLAEVKRIKAERAKAKPRPTDTPRPAPTRRPPLKLLRPDYVGRPSVRDALLRPSETRAAPGPCIPTPGCPEPHLLKVIDGRLRLAANQREATSEHHQIVNRKAYRRKVLGTMKTIMDKLPDCEPKVRAKTARRLRLVMGAAGGML